MTPEQVFSIANGVAVIGWVTLIFLPMKPRAGDLVAGTAVPMLMAVLYTALIATNFFHAEGGFSTLPQVAQLFSHPWLLVAGWVHYLAFDLLVGNWEARDARERGLHHGVLVPCLVLTFLFGPVGWLLYRGVTTTKARSQS
jgi:hypothetical protein